MIRGCSVSLTDAMDREKTALGRKAALEELRIREEERRAAMVARGSMATMCVGDVDLPANCFLYISDPAKPRG